MGRQLETPHTGAPLPGCLLERMLKFTSPSPTLPFWCSTNLLLLPLGFQLQPSPPQPSRPSLQAHSPAGAPKESR